jgi:diaminopimelate epimerase
MELIGNATFVGTATLSLDDLLAGNFSQTKFKVSGEQPAYQAFVNNLK